MSCCAKVSFLLFSFFGRWIIHVNPRAGYKVYGWMSNQCEKFEIIVYMSKYLNHLI